MKTLMNMLFNCSWIIGALVHLWLLSNSAGELKASVAVDVLFDNCNSTHFNCELPWIDTEIGDDHNRSEECGPETRMFNGEISMVGRLLSAKEKNNFVSGEVIEINNCGNTTMWKLPQKASSAKSSVRWIAVVHVSDASYKKSTCNYLDKLKAAVLFGASALLLLTVNQRVIRELENSKQFAVPLVLLSGRNASNLLVLLRRKLHRILVRCSYEEEKYMSGDSIEKVREPLSTLTFWGTCGRPIGWGGLVCIDPDDSDQEVTYLHCIGNSVIFMTTVTMLVLMKAVVSNWLQKYWQIQNEKSLQMETVKLLQHLGSRVYKKRKPQKQRRGSCSDACAICLEDFVCHQILRVLPCGHEYHQICVDPWLLQRRTCPLCKRNLLVS